MTARDRPRSGGRPRSATSCGTWLAENRPDRPGGRSTSSRLMFGDGPGLREWTAKLHEAGYLCVSWPTEYGGRGLTGVEVAVMNEEFARAGVPRVTRGMGEWLVGPSIIVCGTDEQKAYFLPRIIDGTDRYCQGFSEPDAGSDLAVAHDPGRRRRRRGRDHRAEGVDLGRHRRQHDVLPVPHRSRRAQAPRHLLRAHADEAADGSSNGFELRPIRQTTGSSHFTETFITEARAPLFNVIGGLHNGWRVTMTTLGNERGGNATTQHVQYTKQFWRRRRRGARVGRGRTTRSCASSSRGRTRTARSCASRACACCRTSWPGRSRDRRRRSTRCSGRSTPQRLRRDGSMNLRGRRRHGHGRTAAGGLPRPIAGRRTFLSTRSVTIWGGTAQVQRNIVGERVLGLPKEPDARKPSSPTGATS